MSDLILTNTDVAGLASSVAKTLSGIYRGHQPVLMVYPIPRGGIPAAYAVQAASAAYPLCPELIIVATPEQADIFIDDLVDSGNTRSAYEKRYPGKPFYALLGKKDPSEWVVFPWEQKADGEAETAEENVVRLLQYIGEDPKRLGLLETPKRVVKAWKDMTVGYAQNPADILKVFDETNNYDQMITQPRIPYESTCEHHMLPFFGTMAISYVPKDGKVVGASKLKRLVDVFAKRLQMQERLTMQVANAFMEHVQPLGVGVFSTARHMCMECRGVHIANSPMECTALLGVYRQPEVKAEFLASIK